MGKKEGGGDFPLFYFTWKKHKWCPYAKFHILEKWRQKSKMYLNWSKIPSPLKGYIKQQQKIEGWWCTIHILLLRWVNIGKERDGMTPDAVQYARALRPPYHLLSFLRFFLFQLLRSHIVLACNSLFYHMLRTGISMVGSEKFSARLLVAGASIQLKSAVQN